MMTGNPVGKYRRMNLLELGSMTRWQEIRKQNELIDKRAHLNRAALNNMSVAIDDHLRRTSGRSRITKRTARTEHSSSTAPDTEGDAGGHALQRMTRADHSSSSAADTDGELGVHTLKAHAKIVVHQFAERDCLKGQTVEEENEEGRDSQSTRRFKQVTLNDKTVEIPPGK
jgi:hypothetical protein